MTDHAINLEELLQPISDEQPCGIDFRADPALSMEYRNLRNSINAQIGEERKLAEDATSNPSDFEALNHEWSQFAKEIVGILKRSKDLEVGAWLAEAQIRLRGLQGLIDSYELLTAYVDKYWETLLPAEDEDDGFEPRIVRLQAQNNYLSDLKTNYTLLHQIQRIPIFEPTAAPDGGTRPITFRDYLELESQATRARDAQDPKQKEALQQKVEAIQGFLEAGELNSSFDFCVGQRGRFGAALEAVEKLEAALAAPLGKEAPSLKNIRGALEEPIALLDEALKSKGPQPGAASELNSTPDSGAGQAPTNVQGAINSRQQALSKIAEIARYFRQTEPHSPLSYLLERVVRWGNLPLPELWEELIGNTSARESAFWLAGIATKDDGAPPEFSMPADARVASPSPGPAAQTPTADESSPAGETAAGELDSYPDDDEKPLGSLATIFGR